MTVASPVLAIDLPPNTGQVVSIPGELRRVATEIAYGVQDRVSGLLAELEEAKARQSAIEAQIAFIVDAPERASSYRPILGFNPQCPRCWIERGDRKLMIAIPGTETAALFQCSACDLELSFPA